MSTPAVDGTYANFITLAKGTTLQNSNTATPENCKSLIPTNEYALTHIIAFFLYQIFKFNST